MWSGLAGSMRGSMWMGHAGESMSSGSKSANNGKGGKGERTAEEYREVHMRKVITRIDSGGA